MQSSRKKVHCNLTSMLAWIHAILSDVSKDFPPGALPENPCIELVEINETYAITAQIILKNRSK